MAMYMYIITHSPNSSVGKSICKPAFGDKFVCLAQELGVAWALCM
jgi:hypothetical protein